jgi:hypothetical protein
MKQTIRSLLTIECIIFTFLLLSLSYFSHAEAECYTARDVEYINRSLDIKRLYTISGNDAKVFISLDPDLLRDPEGHAYKAIISRNIDEIIIWTFSPGYYDFTLASVGILENGCVLEEYAEPTELDWVEAMYEALELIKQHGITSRAVTEKLIDLAAGETDAKTHQNVNIMFKRVKSHIKEDETSSLAKAVNGADVDKVKHLLSAGKSANTRNRRTGRTPLHIAAGAELLECYSRYARTSRASVVPAEYKEILRQLIDSGGEVNQRDAEGSTALHFAAICNAAGIARLLLDKGATVDQRDYIHGTTPLHLAFENDSQEVGKVLLEDGADPDVRQAQSDTTLLQQSARNGEIDWVDLLLAFGANPNILGTE